MKRINLKSLVVCLSILFSFIFFGCAQKDMTETMDTKMEPAMEDTMDTMKKQGMETPMNEKTEMGMGDTMGEMKDKEMVPEKNKMMR